MERKREEWGDKAEGRSALTSSSLFSRMSWLSVRIQYFLSQTQGSVNGDWPQEKWWLGGPFTSVHRGQKKHLRMGCHRKVAPQKQALFMSAMILFRLKLHDWAALLTKLPKYATTYSLTSCRNSQGSSERHRLSSLLYLISSPHKNRLWTMMLLTRKWVTLDSLNAAVSKFCSTSCIKWIPQLSSIVRTNS